MKPLILLDAGHGGFYSGKYITPGKRSENTKGPILFEGLSNRDLVSRIAFKLSLLGIAHEEIAGEPWDVRLDTRVRRANMLSKTNNCLYISVHSNAHESEDAHGWEIFTSVGNTSSDEYAETFCDMFKKHFPDERLRTPWRVVGDKILNSKEAKFRVLTKTICPAVLTENFFFTNPREREMLMDNSFRDKIVDMHIEAITEILKQPFFNG